MTKAIRLTRLLIFTLIKIVLFILIIYFAKILIPQKTPANINRSQIKTLSLLTTFDIVCSDCFFDQNIQAYSLVETTFEHQFGSQGVRGARQVFTIKRLMNQLNSSLKSSLILLNSSTFFRFSSFFFPVRAS